MPQPLQKALKAITAVFAFLLLLNCSEDTYSVEGHDAANTSKNEVSFSAFKKETQQNHIGLFKSVTLENQFSKGTIESEFIIDTTKIFKHIALNNKTTYSFRIYPIDTNALQPHEYYNLVYHKNGNQWDELLFHNKEAIHPQTGDYRLQSSDMIYRSLRQEQSSKSPSLSAVPMCETVDVSIQCDGSCNGSCDGFACPTGQCIKTTVSYQYCGTIGGGGGGTGGTGGISGESGGGGGLDGVYIPNPYEGEDDVTSPDFVFALDVARFINILPSNLKQVVQANPFLHNTIINFMKNNGGLNTENKNKVAFALSNYNSIASIALSNVPFTTANQLHYWAFNHLLENPNTEAVNFAKDLMHLTNDETNQQDVNALVNMTILMEKNKDRLFEEDVIKLLDPYMDIDLSNPENIQPIIDYYVIQYVILKNLHDDWSDAKIFWEISKGGLHVLLDVLGLVPFLGEAADLTNGAIYAIEGDGVNASLSLVSAIPIAGWAGPLTKYGFKIKNYYNVVNVATTVATKQTLIWRIQKGIVTFGSRNQLRAVLGLGSIALNPKHAHHIIPWAKSANEVIQRAAKSGSAFHMNDALNGIAVAAWRNQPNHFAYDNRIINKLNEILATNPNPQHAYNQLESLINNIKTVINNNPNTHLNDLIF